MLDLDEGYKKVGIFWYSLAGLCSFSGSIISLFTMSQHLKNYRRPELQRNTIRILWMVPVYALASFISLSSKYYSDYIDTIRDIYEAFVIYTFFILLINYLGGERQLLITLENSMRVHQLWPFNYIYGPMDMSNPVTFLNIRRGIFQFVILKPILGILIMLLKVNNAYHEGYIALESSYFWINLFYNISVCTAMYCLVMFYLQSKNELKSFRPLPKFLCVKAIIFFSFWQGFFIAILVATGIITPNGDYSASKVAVALQDLLICFEMVPFAIAHWSAFTWKDFDSSRLSARMRINFAFRDSLGIKDVVQDFKHILMGTSFKNVYTNYETHQEREGEDGDENFVFSSERRFYRSINRKSGYGSIRNLVDDYAAGVEFSDLIEDVELENQYEKARTFIYGDSNYPVIHESFREPPAVQARIDQMASEIIDNFARNSYHSKDKNIFNHSSGSSNIV